jgi:NAD(P)H-dependent FMN reductase
MAGTHVVGICGSLRDGSYTRKSLTYALGRAEKVGATTDLVDLRELDIPVFGKPGAKESDVPEMVERIDDGDAIILATPMYHGSYSSPTKTVLDYCGFDEFEHKAVGLLAISGGSFPVTALDHLRSVCRAVNAWPLPYQAAVPNASSKFEDGEFVDDDIRERVETLGARVVQYSDVELDPDSFEAEANVGANDD